VAWTGGAREPRPDPGPGLRYTLAGEAAGLITDAIHASATWEIEAEQPLRELEAAGRPVIFALWHGRLLPLAYLHRRGRYSMLISRSKDGAYGSGLARHWGFVPVRGSSSRGGGTALRELVEHARAGYSLVFTPDGPRGPREVVKPGVVLAAMHSGAPIVPLTAGAASAWWIEGWDRFLVPRPFTRIRVRYGSPLHVAAGDDIEACCRWLTEELKRITALVDESAPGPAARRAARSSLRRGEKP
jgi:lysophospholipid acyltransferase (LPLAT)-like uncharacterized protein